MPTEISIVVADPTRMPVIRERLRLPGHMMHFTAGNLGPAIENIRSYQPKLIAIDMLFAQTPSGIAFIERVERLATEASDIRLITHVEGRWVTVPRKAAPGAATVSAEVAAAASGPSAVAAQVVALNTRRAPRFLVRDPLNAVVENGTASLVDISVLGAQVVSQPALRPNQTIKIALPDTGEMLRVTAHVAWSMFEKPKLVMEAYYRAGIEFTDAAQLALEDYRLRYCAEEPIPYRSR
jgi:PilZ domain